MAYGKVKWFSNQKGYGFIERHDGGQDAFVHYSDIQEEGWKSLEEDQKVEFELEKTDEGPRAKEIEKIEEFPESAESADQTDEQEEEEESEEDDESLEPPEAFKSTGPAVDSDEDEQQDTAGEPETEEAKGEASPVTPSSILDEEENSNPDPSTAEEDQSDEDEEEPSTDW